MVAECLFSFIFDDLFVQHVKGKSGRWLDNAEGLNHLMEAVVFTVSV